MSITEDRQGDSLVYELSYLLLPSIPEENLSEVVTKIEKVIEEKGGQKIDGENPFLRELAYQMSKVVGASRYVVKNAYIGWVKFELPAEASAEEGLSHPVEEIKESVEKMQEIIRFLLVKAERETKFTFASTMKPVELDEVTEEVVEEVPETDVEVIEDEPVDDEVDVLK